mgnify:CR=1 FL=1
MSFFIYYIQYLYLQIEPPLLYMYTNCDVDIQKRKNCTEIVILFLNDKKFWVRTHSRARRAHTASLHQNGKNHVFLACGQNILPLRAQVRARQNLFFFGIKK